MILNSCIRFLPNAIAVELIKNACFCKFWWIRSHKNTIIYSYIMNYIVEVKDKLCYHYLFAFLKNPIFSLIIWEFHICIQWIFTIFTPSLFPLFLIGPILSSICPTLHLLSKKKKKNTFIIQYIQFVKWIWSWVHGCILELWDIPTG